MKGTVRLTKEGEVRWTTFSIFSGHARWRSEGIQIGGVGSARGVVGHWFDTCVSSTTGKIQADQEQRLRPPRPLRAQRVLQGV